jgi:hypothetical protein
MARSSVNSSATNQIATKIPVADVDQGNDAATAAAAPSVTRASL